MSASREKKARKDGVTPDLVQQQETVLQEQKAKTRKNVMIGIAVTLVVVLLIGSIVLFRGPYFTKNAIAVTTGEHELSPVTVRYYYMDTYNQMYQSYGTMFSSMFPTGENIEDQIFDETTGQTWGDLLMESALEEIRGAYAVYDDAMANGYVLSEAGEQALENTKAMLELYAEMNGITPDGYLRQVYGTGSNMETYMEYQRVMNTVTYYQAEHLESFTYSAEELAETYEADPSAYDMFTYHTYLVTPEKVGEESNNEEVMKAAEAFAADTEGDLEAYLKTCDELSNSNVYINGTSTLRSNSRISVLSDSISGWITDPARQEGDTIAIQEGDTGYYVLYFVSRETNDYDAMNVRSIKLSAVSTADDGTSTTNWELVDAELGFFRTEFDAYEDRIEAYNQLAPLYSDDEATANNGGIYQNVAKGTFEEAVDEWLFGEAHEVGDSQVIKGEDAYYVIYVESIDGTYRDYLVDQDLRSADFNEWVTEVTEGATLEQNEKGMSRVDRTIINQAAQ